MTIKKLKQKSTLREDHSLFLNFLTLKNFESTVLKQLKAMNASEAVEAQAKKKFAEAEKDEKAKTRDFRITTDLGSEVWFFAFGKSSVYEQHTCLRKKIGHLFEGLKKGQIVVDVKSVPLSEQKVFIDAIVSLVTLSQWEPPKVTKVTKASKACEVTLHVFSSLNERDLAKLSDRAKIISEANNLVRTLSDTPANKLKPSTYLELIRERAKKLKYKVDFKDRKSLEKLGAGSFLAVTQGNLEDDGGIVHLSHKPARKKKKLILVGKGLCFDTGGYNIKTRHMYGMQKDMTGSALAISIFESVIRLGLPIEVHAFLGLAENLISHKAYKPSDVVTACDGTTIEVTDTDAEGRMVLADVLALARKEGADLILDFATLTGAVTRAIDTRRSGVFSNQAKLLGKAFECGEKCGERVWGFPIGEDYREMLKSQVADILQCREAPEADHIYAATFLSHFVGEDIPWIHMDLAASENSGGLGLVSTQSTGFGVRWALTTAEEILNV